MLWIIRHESEGIANNPNYPAISCDVLDGFWENVVIPSPPVQIDKFYIVLRVKDFLRRYGSMWKSRILPTSIGRSWSNQSSAKVWSRIFEIKSWRERSGAYVAQGMNAKSLSLGLSCIRPYWTNSKMIRAPRRVSNPVPVQLSRKYVSAHLSARSFILEPSNMNQETSYDSQKCGGDTGNNPGLVVKTILGPNDWDIEDIIGGALFVATIRGIFFAYLNGRGR